MEVLVSKWLSIKCIGGPTASSWIRVVSVPCMVISQSMGRRYTPECLKNEFLVVSNQTAFERDYLIEVVADIYLLQGCFENISKKFNRLKNRQLPTATRERRTELYRKTLTNAFSSTPSLNMVKGMPSKAGKESRAAWRKQWWILKMSLPNLFRRGGPRSTSVTVQDARLVL